MSSAISVNIDKRLYLIEADTIIWIAHLLQPKQIALGIRLLYISPGLGSF